MGSNFIRHPPFTSTADGGAQMRPQTALLHTDGFLNDVTDVAPPIHVSTNFRYSRDPDQLIAFKDHTPETLTAHVYSRHTAPSTTRLEALLSDYLDGYTLVYSSGLAAFHAALVRFSPRRLSLGDCYHGCRGVAALHSRLTGMQQLPLDCPADQLHPGDVIHLETPVNPTGEAHNIAEYAAKAHSRGAILIVDATFAPPPLQDPFAHGADVVLHSASKYIGGHSDILGGVLVTRDLKVREGLFHDRVFLGSTMGGLEAWLGVRSARTLRMRVLRQSANAKRLVAWLAGEIGMGREVEEGEGGVNAAIASVVDVVKHASLQTEEWIDQQMAGGYAPVFAVEMKTELQAKTLPSRLQLFTHATSLGGVESLIEWRAMSDTTISPRLLRLSIGIESWDDLRDDLKAGFESLALDPPGAG